MRLIALTSLLALNACAPLDMGGSPTPEAIHFDRGAMRFEAVDIGIDAHLGSVWSGGAGQVHVTGIPLPRRNRAWLAGRITERGFEALALPADLDDDAREASVIAGSRSGALWMLGRAAHTASPLVRFDGQRWIAAQSFGADYIGTALWVSGDDDVWIGGTYGSTLHWNGQRWTNCSPDYAVNPFFRGAIMGLWAHHPADVWAVGSGAREPHRAAGHWDGFDWTFYALDASPLDVWGSGQDDVWAVGEEGAIWRWRGATWARVESGVEHDLTAIHGLGPDAIWAVGARGTILFWDGETWGAVDAGTDADLYDVWAGPDAVWAVGDDSAAVRFTR